MVSRAAALALLVAVTQARFNQEQIPIPAIAAVNGGDPGVAPTIAGAAVSDLLAASNACDKLKRGDQILEELGTGADAVAAAIGIVAAEKNFNPFVQDIPTICSDPTLPVNVLLRGITPLIDPAVDGSDVANALSAQTVATPLDATDMSVADLLTANGFANFISQDADGATTQPDAGADAGAGDDAAATDAAAAATETATANATAAATATATEAAVTDACGAAVASALASASSATATATATEVAAAANETATATEDAAAAEETATATEDAAAAEETAAAGDDAGSGAVEQSSIAGVDFGLCVPTMKFEGGLGGRPDTEFTFQAIDPLVAEGQQEALNPNIIVNRICDQLTNVCEANQAAKDLCDDVQTQIEALGTRDKTTADTFNTLLGFEGAVTNPDGGPAEPPAKMRVVRSYRA